MDSKILKKLGEIEKALQKAATRDDLKRFATKDDLKRFATKDDLKKFSTREDLKQLKDELMQKIDDTELAIISRVDKFKADKDMLAALENRVGNIERKLSD